MTESERRLVSQVIVPEMYCLESVVRGQHVYKQEWTPMVGNKLPVDIKEDDANEPRAVAVRTCDVLSATYQELVHWLQVSMKTHDGRLTFAKVTLSTCSHTGIPPYTH